jgi:hypothetical protein
MDASQRMTEAERTAAINNSRNRLVQILNSSSHRVSLIRVLARMKKFSSNEYMQPIKGAEWTEEMGDEQLDRWRTNEIKSWQEFRSTCTKIAWQVQIGRQMQCAISKLVDDDEREFFLSFLKNPHLGQPLAAANEEEEEEKERAPPQDLTPNGEYYASVERICKQLPCLVGIPDQTMMTNYQSFKPKGVPETAPFKPLTDQVTARLHKMWERELRKRKADRRHERKLHQAQAQAGAGPAAAAAVEAAAAAASASAGASEAEAEAEAEKKRLRPPAPMEEWDSADEFDKEEIAQQQLQQRKREEEKRAEPEQEKHEVGEDPLTTESFAVSEFFSKPEDRIKLQEFSIQSLGNLSKEVTRLLKPNWITMKLILVNLPDGLERGTARKITIDHESVAPALEPDAPEESPAVEHELMEMFNYSQIEVILREVFQLTGAFQFFNGHLLFVGSHLAVSEQAAAAA